MPFVSPRRALAALTLVAGCGDEARLSLRGEPDASAALDAAGCARSEQCDDRDPCTTDLCVVGNVCEHERVAGCVTPRRCARAAECDDGVGCTRDRCLVSGLCDSVADDALCPVGARCEGARGCVGEQADGGVAAIDAGSRDAATSSAEDAPVAHDQGGALDRPAEDRPMRVDVVAAQDVIDASGESDPRSGRYSLVPAVAYACQDEVFKTPIVSLAIAELTLDARVGGVTVSWPGGATTLRGPPIAGGSARAEGSIPHPDCTTHLSLSGSFPDAVRFSGALSLRFSGIGCALTGCEARSFTVNGTRNR